MKLTTTYAAFYDLSLSTRLFFMRYFSMSFSALCLLLATGFFIEQYNLDVAKVFQPQYEQLRNDTFHNSQAYTDGMKSQLAKSLYEFSMTDDHVKKSAICAVVRLDYGSFNTNGLPYDLLSFINTCNTWK